MALSSGDNSEGDIFLDKWIHTNLVFLISFWHISTLNSFNASRESQTLRLTPTNLWMTNKLAHQLLTTPRMMEASSMLLTPKTTSSHEQTYHKSVYRRISDQACFAVVVVISSLSLYIIFHTWVPANLYHHTKPSIWNVYLDDLQMVCFYWSIKYPLSQSFFFTHLNTNLGIFTQSSKVMTSYSTLQNDGNGKSNPTPWIDKHWGCFLLDSTFLK